MVEFVGFSNVVLVGEGGLGRVYRAEKDSTGGVVAIKELIDIAEGSAAWHRARRELEAMLRLKGHPYVVSVEEILQGPSGPLLVMEYLPGGSLAERVDTGPLPAPEIVLVGQHVSQALAAAHDVGIVHRDVKPHNLMVGGFGQVKVCDFGISALARGDGRTQTKAMTLAYAAPEELDGDEFVGPPADVYSMSATMLHLVTGRRPSFRDRLSGDWSIPDGLDPALVPVMDLVRRGLAHDPAARPEMTGFLRVFDDAARALGDRSVRQIPVSASDADDTVNAATGAVPVAVNDTILREDANAAAVGSDAPTRIRGSSESSSSNPQDPVPAGHGDGDTTQIRRRKRPILLGTLAALALIGISVTLLLSTRDSSADPPTTAVVGTLAGTGTSGSRDGPAATATFDYPVGVAVDAAGNVYVADTQNNRIRRIAPDGVVSTLAGTNTAGSTDGPAATATFSSPSGVAVDAAGNVYVADTQNNSIRRIAPDGVVSTLAGNAGTSGSRDGPAATATFDYPSGVAVDAAGNVYVADTENHKIRRIAPDGVVSTMAGTGTAGSTDGPAATAGFRGPTGVVVDAAGNVYVADAQNNRIRRIAPDGVVSTLAGTNIIGSRTTGSNDGPAGTATFDYPFGVAVDAAGNVYVADTQNNKIRRLAPDGIVSTLAGTGTRGSIDGPAATATFANPFGVAVDTAGNVYVADADNNKIRKVEVPPSPNEEP